MYNYSILVNNYAGGKMKKVVLGYSGGLDTSVLIRLIKDYYKASVITATIDVGQYESLDAVRMKALDIGSDEAVVIDAREEFIEHYVLPLLKGNGLYEGAYPLATAIARPLIAQHLTAVARRTGAEYIAHGCTAKGNDQVRFETSIALLDPDIKVLAPLRELMLSRSEEVEYARRYHIPIQEKLNKYSIDENFWGRSIECGAIEDETCEPPADAFAWTKSITDTPDEPVVIELGFKAGRPITLNEKTMNGFELINTLNQLGGLHGVGVIDHIESRLVGIKSREVYEAPAATVLIKAHQDIEKITLTKDILHFKPIVELRFAELVYNGLWFTPLRRALSAFIEEIQQDVTGTVRMRLYKGSAHVIARSSNQSLYVKNLATYTRLSKFDDESAQGFINLWSLPYRIYGQVKNSAQKKLSLVPVLEKKKDNLTIQKVEK
jgi:argininosuccinate synthase